MWIEIEERGEGEKGRRGEGEKGRRGEGEKGRRDFTFYICNFTFVIDK
jgi:hypothetical protein